LSAGNRDRRNPERELNKMVEELKGCRGQSRILKELGNVEKLKG